MRDNHLHTHFSFDSETAFQAYLDAYEGELVTTEQFDLSNPLTQSDDVPDYEGYCREIDSLNQIYGHRIKKGIEIGYYAPREADILAFLDGKDFDLKLLSVHHDGVRDYLDEEVASMDKHVVMEKYFAALEYAIGRVEADVLAHFDYGFRVFEVSVEELQVHEEQLRRIFKKMMDHGLAFELNCKSMYLYENEHLYVYALGILKELGCRRYSVGSDGHRLEHFRLRFDQVADLLATYGISEAELI